MSNRINIGCLTISVFLIATLVGCNNISPAPGVDYHVVKINAEMTSHFENADVIYFFKYSCPACLRFHGDFKGWRAELERRDSINVMAVPVVFSTQDDAGARLHYALEAMDVGPDYQSVLYQAVKLNRDSGGIDWNVVEPFIGGRFTVSDIERVMRSNDVDEKIKFARRAAQAVGIRAVPSLLVRGKYLVDSSSISGSSKMLHVVETLLLECSNSGNGLGRKCN